MHSATAVVVGCHHLTADNWLYILEPDTGRMTHAAEVARLLQPHASAPGRSRMMELVVGMAVAAVGRGRRRSAVPCRRLAARRKFCLKHSTVVLG